MPWRYKTVNQIREEFVRRVLSNEKSKSALCREYGISRPTADKWIKRYLSGEPLDNRSKKPFKTANRISEDIERLIVNQRKKEPALGAIKIHKILSDEGYENLPSVSTINNVLHRNGLITKEASISATPYKHFAKDNPNDMWQADFKGNYLLKDGVRCHPLSIIDDCSRYCLCADVKYNEKLNSTYASFESTFKQYGLPKILLCDNGTPWGASQSTSITKFEVKLMELGILTLHIRPLRPQTQGKIERFNRSFKEERLRYYIPNNMEEAQEQRLEYMEFYNNKRPHFALDLDKPSEHYEHSKRKYPEKISGWDYPYGTEVLKVKSSGYIRYKGQGYYLSEGLSNKQVGIIPSKQDGILNIIFRQFRVAKLDLDNHTIIARRVYKLHNDPRAKV